MKSPLAFFTCLILALLLTQCVGPDGRPMSPFGPAQPRPYTDQREQYRNDVRDYSQQENAQTYERGQEDGRSDLEAGEQKSYQRHYRNYTQATRTAYQDGYDRAYGAGPQPPAGNYGPGNNDNGGYAPGNYGNGNNNGGYPNNNYNNQGGNQGSGYDDNRGGSTSNGSSAPTADPAYNQGYDYGLRDRVGGRPSDPAAHSGSYDPRYRRSFERGYGDAYDSARRR